MKILLDIATILGGIAALWFFWDRFRTYRHRHHATSSEKSASSFTPTSKSPQKRLYVSDNTVYEVIFLLFGAISGALGGIVAGLLISRYDVGGALAASIGGLISVLIISAVTGENYRDSPKIFKVLLIGSAFMSVSGWGGMLLVVVISGYLNSTFKESGLAIWFTMISGIVGAIYGFAFVDD